MKLILTCVMCALLAACGGGGGAACTATVQLFGDSTMAGASPYWKELYGAQVESRAVGGTNTVKLIAGTDGMNRPWPRSVDATYYVVNHGLNDGNRKPNRNGISLDEYRANLRILAEAPGATAIFQTPNPSTGPYREGIGEYAQAMRDVASEYGLQVIDVYACFQEQPNWRDRLPDDVHPDPDGYQYIVNTCVAPVMGPLLRCE